MSQTKAELIKGLNINASAPATALTIDSSGQIEAGSLGTASSPVYSFLTDQNTGIYSPGADQVAVATNGSGRLFVDSSGQVGIGGSPGAPLHVKPGSGDSYINVTSVTSSASVIFNDSGTGGNYPKVGSEGNNLVLRGGSLNNAVTIDSSQRVGIGTTSPSELLHVNGNALIEDRLLLQRLQSSDNLSVLTFSDTLTGSKGNNLSLGNPGGFDLLLHTGGVERARIDSSGRLGIGTSSPGAKLDVSGSGNLVRLGDGTNTFDVRFQGPNNWDVQLDTSADTFSIRRNSSSKVTVSPAGNVGIGVTPSAQLDVKATTGTLFRCEYTGVAQLNIGNGGNSINYYDSDTQIFRSGGGTERARLDSSGRLLVGTSTVISNNYGGTAGRLQVANNDYLPIGFFTYNNTAGDGGYCPYLELNRARGTQASPSAVGNGDDLGLINFYGHDGATFIRSASIKAVVDGAVDTTNDMPGRLVFSTTADGAASPTERMRITNGGRLEAWGGSAINSFNLVTQAAAGTTYYLIYGAHSSSGAGNYGTQSFGVWSNGNVVNTNNSYGAISDIKLKENIVDAGSQWADIKAFRVRKYNFKEGQTHTQIGGIAQEVELVSPGLVTESPDRDEEGNDLGTVTKSINYSVLYMKAVKALQEAMERIEQLETEKAAQQTVLDNLLARVTALETA